jgi:hypothetical protein
LIKFKNKMEFEASRLSDGNKIFPARIIIEPIGITLKIPGLFGGKEKTIPFHLISSVKLKTPFIGYSTIIIYSVGWDVITAAGFTAADVTAIKKQIEIGQENYKKQRAANSIASPNFVENSQSNVVENSQSNSVGSHLNSKTNLSKWQKELTQLSELTDDDIITEEDFKSQKSVLLSKLAQDSSLVMTDALRMLKDLEEDDVITEFEFNGTKQNLMKPKSSENTINTTIIQTIIPQVSKEEPSNSDTSSSLQNNTPQTTNSESMYDDQLEKFIEMALMDGELSEKEREILFKKAAAAGIDLDEFEMVLSARLYEKQQKNNSQANTIPVIPQSSTPPPVQPIPQAQQNVNNNKMGDLRKCPACNAIVQSYSAICADCGHSFSNISAVSSVTKLHEQLIAVESEERERESNEKNQPSQKSSLFSSFDPSASLKAYKSLTTNIEEIILTRKASIISSFPIPNSKEDILEFLTMAVPECKNKPNFMMMATGKGKIYKAWFTKAEQIVMKAKFSLKEDKKAMEEITYYANQINIKVN